LPSSPPLIFALDKRIWATLNTMYTEERVKEESRMRYTIDEVGDELYALWPVYGPGITGDASEKIEKGKPFITRT